MITKYAGQMVSLIAALFLTSGQTFAGNMMGDKPMTNDNMAEMLHGSGDHHATGGIMLETDRMGQATLVLSDIKVDKVPDGRVYLAKGGDYKNGVELGKLKKFRGTVKFKIPANVDPAQYDSVVIWCKKFDVEIGRGPLRHMMMEDTDGMNKMDKMNDTKMMDGDAGMM